jgi:hypothetical protein
MKDELQQILEDCLELLEQGASIEDCLNKYPADAGELKSLLNIAQRSRRSLHYAIPRDAKARIRTRIMTHYDRQHWPRGQKTPIWSLLRRWAYVTIFVLTFLIVAGVGLNVASANAVPGDTLYPVKRSFEEIQIAFSLSDMAKAETHVRLAERRINEIVELARKGESEYIPGLVSEVTANLERSEQYASVSDADLSLFTTQLENSALGQLDQLEQIRPNITEDNREVVDAALRDTGSAYGNVIEAATSNPPQSGGGVGRLMLYIGDLPPDQVDHMLLQIGGVEIYRPGSDKEWITVTDQPILVDMMDIAGAWKLIAEEEIDAGSYTKLRIHITGITLTIGEETIEAYVPGQELNIVRPFKISEGETTELFLDIDWKKSIIVSEEDQQTMTPATLLLVSPDDKEHGPPDDKEHGPPDKQPK